MSATDGAKKSLPREEGSDTLFQEISEHITTLTHVLTFGITVLIVYLCIASNDWGLVTWHVFLFTIGRFLLATEAILFLIKENLFSKRTSKRMRDHVHWIVVMLGMGFSIAGFVTIYTYKSVHFSSDHSKVGLTAFILACVACVNGVPALFSTRLRKIISPNWNKLFHGFVGFSSVVISAYAMITAYYTHWFKSKVGDEVSTACFVLTILITLWTSLRPLINIVVRIKNAGN